MDRSKVLSYHELYFSISYDQILRSFALFSTVLIKSGFIDLSNTECSEKYMATVLRGSAQYINAIKKKVILARKLLKKI